MEAPLAVFERFLKMDAPGTWNSDEARALVAGEFAKCAPSYSTATPQEFDAIVRVDAEHAVARVTVHDPGGRPLKSLKFDGVEPRTPALDFNRYFYLEKSDAWRVVSMRTLEQLGMRIMMVALDDAIPEQDPALAGSVAHDRLTLESDPQLAQWFADHRSDLESLAARSLELSKGKAAEFSEGSALDQALAALHVDGTEVDSEHTVKIKIGGYGNDIVGLMRLAETATLPHISPEDMIWAQSLGGGWFLFRTT